MPIEQTTEPKPKIPLPRWILLFPIGYTAVLILLAVLWGAFKSHLPNYLAHPFGGMPLAVPWFGALGGILAGFHGVFMHNDDWDASYNYWHMLNAPVGALFGVVTYLILLVTVKTTTATATIKSDSSTFTVAAFIIGYSQQSFLRLLTQVTGVIFGPGGSAKQKGTGANRADQDTASQS